MTGSGIIECCDALALPGRAEAGRVHDYVMDGSVLPTQDAANPAMTIMAIAARAADRMIEG